MVVPDASRSRHVAFLKQSCGFSTQVRNGICCRKAIPTTKRYIGGFRLGAAMSFFGGCWRVFLKSFAGEGGWVEKKASSTRRPRWPKGGGGEVGGPKPGKGVKKMRIFVPPGLRLPLT